MSNPKISDTEMFIMDYLWTQTAGAKIGDIQRYIEKTSDRKHKQQAVRVLLTRLQNKGYVKVYIDKETNHNVYVAAQSRDDFLQKESEKIVNKLFKGSIFDFLVSFSGGVEIDKEETEKIKKFFDR